MFLAPPAPHRLSSLQPPCEVSVSIDACCPFPPPRGRETASLSQPRLLLSVSYSCYSPPAAAFLWTSSSSPTRCPDSERAHQTPPRGRVPSHPALLLVSPPPFLPLRLRSLWALLCPFTSSSSSSSSSIKEEEEERTSPRAAITLLDSESNAENPTHCCCYLASSSVLNRWGGCFFICSSGELVIAASFRRLKDQQLTDP